MGIDRITEAGVPPITAVPSSGYTAKMFDKGKYEVESYSYPSDLMGHSVEYGDNYVMFYINVSDASKMMENPGYANQQSVTIDASERDKGIMAGQELNAGQATAGVGTTTLPVGAIAGAISSGSGTAVRGALLGAGAGVAVAGATTGAVALSTKGKFAASQKRLKTAIALNVPNQLSIRYAADWSGSEDMTVFQAGVELVTKPIAAVGRTTGASDNKANANSLSSIATSIALQKGPGGEALSKITGLAANPMKEQIFRGIDFRTFSMEYMFAPRNEREAQNVLNIIQAFKYHMMPELREGSNFLFIYPSEFDVVYYHAGQENLNVHRHTSCVLVDMNVNYTPQGVFNTFKNGMPTQIGINLTFKELAITTKEMIAKGM